MHVWAGCVHGSVRAGDVYFFAGAWELEYLEEAIAEKLKNPLAVAQLMDRIRSFIGREKVSIWQTGGALKKKVFSNDLHGWPDFSILNAHSTNSIHHLRLCNAVLIRSGCRPPGTHPHPALNKVLWHWEASSTPLYTLMSSSWCKARVNANPTCL